MAKIGLGLTTFNGDRFLAEAIESVLNQTEPDFELHIVDDGSSDSSVHIARRYAACESKIKVHALPFNCGPGHALGYALDRAAENCDFIGWLDQDDRLSYDCLDHCLAELIRLPDVGMVYSSYRLINEDGGDLGPGGQGHEAYSLDRLLVDFMVFHFRLMRKSVYQKSGGVSIIPAAVDYDFVLKISEIAEIWHLPEYLYFYRVHPSSLSRRSRAQQLEQSRLAVQRAMIRRGIADRFDLRVDSKFSLVFR